MSVRVGVLGAGAFGTALAISLAQQGPVLLWARDKDHAAEMQKTRLNARRLPGRRFAQALKVSGDIRDIGGLETVLLAVPMQKLRGFVTEHAEQLAGKTLVACCKGIELSTGLGPVSVLRDVLPGSTAAILTGPSFADDIAQGLPTALTLACADDDRGAQLQQQLSTATLRIYRTTDTLGAELGGALKNVIAIACGTVMGAGLGESARAALMTRGYAEMQRLAAHLGADPATLAGLAGFGDLTLTCTSEQSRNYRLGRAIGQGVHFDPDTTVEGAATALAVHEMARKAALDMPITSAVAALLEKRLDVATAMKLLLSRPLKEE